MTKTAAPCAISSYVVKDGVAVLAIDAPPVNALGADVRQALDEGLLRAFSNEGVEALVIRCDGRTFFAGADIAELSGELRRPNLRDVLATIDGAGRPVIAAIHGTALGGGLELALACHYRIAATTAKVGLPEVSLGLLPGAGGTQRLPRIAGVRAALDIMIGGEAISAIAAVDAGIIDRLSDGDLEEDAIAFARALIADGAPLRRIRDRTPDLGPVDGAAVIEAYRRDHPAKFRGFLAPDHIAKAIEAAVSLPFDEGMEREWELFEVLRASPQSLAQRHIFFAERAAAKAPGLSRDVRPLDIRAVTVIGAGPTGSEIAATFIDHGFSVLLVDHEPTSIEQARASIRDGVNLAEAVKDSDLVIDASDGDRDARAALFTRLAAAAKQDAILATATGFVDLDLIAAGAERSDMIVGLHLVGPRATGRMIEVVRGVATSDLATATAMALGRKLGRIAVMSGLSDGTITTRVAACLARTVEGLVLGGVDRGSVEEALVEHGVALESSRTLEKAIGGSPGDGVPAPAFFEAGIFEHLLSSVAKEGEALLESGVALCASDIDVALVRGFGWPIWCGGPMFWSARAEFSGDVTM